MATKQKEAEAVLQAKIDAEVKKRTKDLTVLPPPSLAKPKTKTVKAADVDPDQIDEGVSLASGASQGAKRRKKNDECAEQVVLLADRLTVFEEVFVKVAAAATKKKSSRYSSEDVTRPNKSPDSVLRSAINAVQRGLQKALAREPKSPDDLANKVRALLKKDASPVKPTPTTPRRSPRRISPRSVESMDTSGVASDSMRTGSSGLRGASKAGSVSFDAHGIDNPPSPLGSVFRTFQAHAVARGSLGGTQVLQKPSQILI